MPKEIDFNLIPFFLAIYEEGNISVAAKKLGVTQPAASKNLKRLRDKYDDVLFIRHHNGVSPSNKAIEIYPALAAANKLYASTLEHLNRFSPISSDRSFSMACINIASYQLVPELLAKIREKAPNITIDVHPLYSEDYEMDLRVKRYDFVIDVPQIRTSSLRYETIGKRELVVVCSKNHPRLGEMLTKQEFLEEDHVVLASWQHKVSPMSNSNIIELSQRNTPYSVSNALDMLKTVEQTDMVCLMDSSISKSFQHVMNIKVLPFPFDQTQWELCLIYHPNRVTDSGHKWMRNVIKATSEKINKAQS
ncbi:LysR family transcriptional regulator [Vibrio campbellii]|uniref:LysR family transcriptional regulator n=2 Tax=Vibrio campbellii TaxID=680 RepID=UPI0005ED5484|nr:LysR family transcriptional regulator [Vibrio campbellii]AYO09398.1 LysR family transcriptional regulator [Vibrio campbellii]MCC8256303.1 LysR family transcriptional regulator [Vibrio campbellii CAIM 333]OPH49767.1 hypothetical protein B4U81_19110 [Vibrio campbellii]